MKKFFSLLMVLAVSASFTLSCNKEPNPEPEPYDYQESYEQQQKRKTAEQAQKFMRDEIMKKYYYWYDLVPDLALNYKTDIYKYFDKLLWSGDRWSWMMDGQEYIAEESGIMSGTYGASLGQPWMDFSEYFDGDYNIVVRYVHPNSPFDKAGITRGCVMTEIDGKSISSYWLTSMHIDRFNDLLNYPSTTESHTFKFTKPDGEEMTCEIIAAETLNTRPGLIKKIFTAEDYPGLTKPVGYFHYLGFMADDDVTGKSMLEDITDAMAYFKANDIKTLILDLRYNGGGDSRASDLLVSYLAPESARGEVYVTRTHNSKLSKQNKSQVVADPLKVLADLEKSYGITFSNKPEAPNFEKLYFITGRGSASASEMSLNGLKPLADVQHVGDTTYGKPNGMYVFYYPGDNDSYDKYDKGDYSKLQYVILPICFYNANGLGQNIPDSGMIPDLAVPDDLYHDFDASEMNIEACLYDVVNGTYPEIPKHKTRASQKAKGEKLMIFKSEEDSNENYGRYVVKPDFL